MRCTGCNRVLPEADFRRRTGNTHHTKDKPYGRCIDCRRVEKSGPRKYITQLIYKAKIRKSETNIRSITIDHMLHVLRLQSGVCPLTGLTLTFQSGSGVVFTNASLDRIDPRKGYIQGNVRLVTLWANLARNSLTDEDFFYFCNLVVTRHFRKV
jgi:hypothetical protein